MFCFLLNLAFLILSLNCIVLLKLAETVKMDNFINKICLPIQNHFTYLLDKHFLNNVIEDRKFSINRYAIPYKLLFIIVIIINVEVLAYVTGMKIIWQKQQRCKEFVQGGLYDILNSIFSSDEKKAFWMKKRTEFSIDLNEGLISYQSSNSNTLNRNTLYMWREKNTLHCVLLYHFITIVILESKFQHRVGKRKRKRDWATWVN